MKNEKLLRKEIVDNCLKQASWIVGDRSLVIEEHKIIVASDLIQEVSSTGQKQKLAAELKVKCNSKS